MNGRSARRAARDDPAGRRGERAGDRGRAGATPLGAGARHEGRAPVGHPADAVPQRAGPGTARRLGRRSPAGFAAASRDVGAECPHYPVAGDADTAGRRHSRRSGLAHERPLHASDPRREAREGHGPEHAAPGALPAVARRERTRPGGAPEAEPSRPEDDRGARRPLPDPPALPVHGTTSHDADVAERGRPWPAALRGHPARYAQKIGSVVAAERVGSEPVGPAADRAAGRARRFGGTVLALVLLAGCAREPPVAIEPGSDPAEARRELAAAAAAGPVPLVLLRLEERPSEAEAAGLAARGVSGLGVRFVPAPPSVAGRRLVLALDGLEEPAAICAGAERSAPAAADRAVLAAWCDGARAVARVRLPAGVDRVERERAVWRAVARLFPDDYAETYGWNLFGLRVTVGGSFGF